LEDGVTMKKKSKLLNIDNAFYFLVFIVAIIQLRSILVEKPFWYDEWFVIANLKFRAVSDFWGSPLDGLQMFPRIYLLLIKLFSELFDHSFLSIRIIPYIVQILAFFLYFKIIKTYFNWSPGYVLLAAFFIVSLHTSTSYFSQIKQYSMEIFMSAVALYQYFNFGKKKTVVYTPFFLGPLFSYTYPIVISPLFINEFIQIVIYKNKEKKYYFFIASFLFLISIIISIMTDLKYVLGNPSCAWWYESSLASYTSVKSFFYNMCLSFFNFFTIIWSQESFFNFLYIKILVCIISVIGLGCIICKKKDPIEKYIITLLVVIFALFLAKLMPIGPNRLNCSFVIIVIYCFIFGADSIKNILKNSLISRNIVLVFMYFVALFPLAYNYGNELMGKNDLFSRSMYKNFGSAISKAYELNSDIYVSEAITEKLQNNVNFIPLGLKSHPNYKASSPKDIFIVKDINDICVKKGSNISSVVFITSSSEVKVTSPKQCDHQIKPAADVFRE
jgi:hypothetical protein